ncbi:MAG: energy-coupling factor transporter ATPase [Clostridiales bacterium]|uniref:energy-coupling factor transporter ATPase n=1 Tax=Provencibacterium massiliense TaxID=1841868 RepID=UPI0009A8A577|nr:energy-coupling factor transporter ATPase [Provencibacterium massiliense]PWM35254.1 MAG: energy-coupling factor transporter ATPase [Clostridiales bacterium]RGB66546.1 energy-coupling factor transporter ATPase [Harryflintia acetispora]
MPAIKTEHLSYIYSPGTPFEKTAVDDVNVEIESGEFVGVIGHTGSGKSTLIQHFNGLLEPTAGKVYIDGEDLWADKSRLRDFRFKVGLVFQYPEYQLFEDTVYKDISFGPRNMGMSEEEIHKSVMDAAAFVGLKEKHMEKSPFELSGGQKRRVAIAGVIAMNPKVLILDEPTAGLDPKGRDRILGQIREYHQQVGNTVLLVSHSMEDIARYSKKVLVMNQSRLFMYADVAEVFEHADQIAAMGLSVPQITRIFHRLSAEGYPVRRNIYDMQRAKDEILRLLSERGKA